MSDVPELVWHDLECGSYRADLALWSELAREHGDPILDVGAGSGRVALHLARAGHQVIALDRDRQLLDALSERANGFSVRTVCADARSFALPERQPALCLAPMQTIQLLGGSAQRTEFLRRAHAHLKPGGLLACAIVTDLQSYDCTSGPAPRPDIARADDLLYVSYPISVRVLRERIVIERDRLVIKADEELSDDALASRSPLRRTHSTIELDRLSPRQLEREACAVGFRPEPLRRIAMTEDHVGSEVVMLRA
jgi:SAM-dependent methyltransferase